MSLGEQLEARLRDRTRQQLDQVRVFLPETVKAPLADETGQLRAGIIMDDWSENGNRYESTIRSLAPYSLYVDQGTGVYGPTGSPIYPTTAKALTFYWTKRGGWYSFKHVLGTPAQHFFGERMPTLFREALEAMIG